MAMKCINCGKGSMYGHNVSHANNRTRKIFRPNVHTVRISIGSTMKRMKLCTKCSRMIKKASVLTEANAVQRKAEASAKLQSAQ